jgi:hypothetical protein
VDGQLPAADALAGAGRRDQLLGQDSGLAGSDHPADGIPAEDGQDHVEVVVRPFRGAMQLGDVPGVNLVRPGGQQLRLDRGGMGGLREPFPALPGLAQHPVAWTPTPGRCPHPAGSPTPRQAPGQRSGRYAARRGWRGARSVPAPAAGAGHGAARAPAAAGPRSPGAGGKSWPAHPAAAHAARMPITGAIAAIASPVTMSARARCPRPRRSSPSQERLQFDWTSTMKRAFASSCSSRAFCLVRREICASRGSAAGRPRDRSSPASAPLSRARQRGEGESARGTVLALLTVRRPLR